MLLDYTIVRAVVDELVFSMPVSMKDAKISAQNIRQTIIEPVESEDGQPERVQVKLLLQDKVIGNYVVIVENDRALSSTPQSVPLAVVDGVTVKNRYATIQNTGRDEVIIDDLQGVERLTRGQRQWQDLSRKLGGGDMTLAYTVSGSANDSRLVYKTNRREIVQTAGATIGLSQTVITVDGSGAYRAEQVYKVNNRTEQFLEIELPKGAQVWTAIVAGQPSKPTRVPGVTDESRLRIPLVKTSEGDLDFDVSLKYGGRLGSLDALKKIRFPIIRTVNVNIELSTVRLLLPKTHRWFNFGGTATRSGNQGAWLSGVIDYETKQIQRLSSLANSSNSYSKARVKFNLKQLSENSLSSRGFVSRSDLNNQEVQSQLSANLAAIDAAEKQIDLQSQQESVTTVDNRGNLNTLFDEQRNGYARNNVTKLENNFDFLSRESEQQDKGKDGEFNREWFSKNALSNSADLHPGEDKGESKQANAANAAKEGGKGGSAAPSRVQGARRKFAQGQVPADNYSLDFGNESTQKELSLEISQMQSLEKQERFDESNLQEKYFEKLNAPASGRLGQVTQNIAPQEGFGDVQSGINSLQDADGDSSGQQVIMLDDFENDFGGEIDGLSGLASLQVEFPKRGSEYLFTTPRGDIEITARVVASDTVSFFAGALWLLGIAVAISIGFYTVQKIKRSRKAVIVVSCVACLVGIAMLLSGFLPLLGLLMILVSVTLLFQFYGVGQTEPA